MMLGDASFIRGKIYRRDFGAKVRARKLCRDDRNYFPVTYTVSGDIGTGDYEPMWRADRHFYIARISANIGKHDDATHPDDGTPSGQAVEANIRRVTADLSSDNPVLNADDRLQIAIDHHQDTANDAELGDLALGDFAITELAAGEHIYLRIGQVGSDRLGRGLVVTVTLVPIR